MKTRIAAIAGKEFRQVLRDKRILAIMLLLPIIQLLLFAYAISFDVRNVPTWVVDNDNSVASRTYTAALTASGTFQVAGVSTSQADIDTAFEFSRARIAVVIPAGFAAAVARGEPGEIGIMVDGSEPNSARVARAAAMAMSIQYGNKLRVQWATAQGLSLPTGGIEPRVRTWFNPELRSSDFLIPGLMVVILMIVTVQQTAISLVKERDLGTAEQLEVSPLRSIELIIGKLIPWTALAFVDLAVITWVSITGFGVPLRGDPLALLAGATAFIITGLGIGLCISAVAPTADVASISALLVAFLPSFLLSDFAFPLDQIPFWLEWLSQIFPGRYMVTITREVFLKGGGFGDIWPELGALSIFAVVLMSLAAILNARRRA